MFQDILLLSILKKFDVITVTGIYTKKFLESKGIDEKKIFVLPPVVDDRFRPLNIDKKYDVISIGRLTAVKHVETLVKAIAIVKEAIPSIRVAIVGEGEESNHLKELTHSLGLIDQIDFVGFQEDAWEWYNRSKLLSYNLRTRGLSLFDDRIPQMWCPSNCVKLWGLS